MAPADRTGWRAAGSLQPALARMLMRGARAADGEEEKLHKREKCK